MTTAARLYHACVGLLAIAVWLGGAVGGVRSGSAQAPAPQADHLACYQVVQDTNRPQRLRGKLVTPRFNSTETCAVPPRATLFCTPTAKVSTSNPQGDDPRGGPLDPQTDYVCYKVSCQPPVSRTVQVDDQFTGTPNRLLRLNEAQFLCTPTTRPRRPGTP